MCLIAVQKAWIHWAAAVYSVVARGKSQGVKSEFSFLRLVSYILLGV